MAAWNPGGQKFRVLLAPRISRDHFFFRGSNIWADVDVSIWSKAYRSYSKVKQHRPDKVRCSLHIVSQKARKLKGNMVLFFPSRACFDWGTNPESSGLQLIRDKRVTTVRPFPRGFSLLDLLCCRLTTYSWTRVKCVPVCSTLVFHSLTFSTFPEEILRSLGSCCREIMLRFHIILEVKPERVSLVQAISGHSSGE